MAERLFYCDTCNVHLTGQQPALQHYNGSKHRKKEAVKLVGSNAMFGSATGHLTTDSGRQTGSLNSPGSASDDGMKSETALKSLEAAPSCSIVMVPPLNPALPPVPVTMTENVLPQTEYEFNGSGGSCHLCDIQLTSQQHADQHLSGQTWVNYNPIIIVGGTRIFAVWGQRGAEPGAWGQKEGIRPWHL